MISVKDQRVNILGFAYHMMGDPKNLSRIYLKNGVLILLVYLNFSHLQSTLHLMKYTYQDIFSLLITVF